MNLHSFGFYIYFPYWPKRSAKNFPTNGKERERKKERDIHIETETTGREERFIRFIMQSGIYNILKFTVYFIFTVA